MSPGAGAELQHLLNGVKSKTSKPEALDLKDKGISPKPKTLSPKDKGLNLKAESDEAEALNLKDKGIDQNAEALSLNDKGLRSKPETLNLKALGEAIKGANSNRQTVAIWSPEISAVLWYLKKTTPEFSISDEARSILEKGLQKKYPELYKHVIEAMEKAQ
ncbi:Uncharacterised protein [uncultured archaeon]|nr:Uncharacterised protein [uncultured archaeon]